MSELVLHDIATTEQGEIHTLTMNRGEKRNALSFELIDALGTAVNDLERAIEAGTARVMILAGAGRSFCAGMDLRGVLDDPSKMANMLRRLSEVSRQIRRLPIPTIACVQGAAVGGGCGLMVVPDFAFIHPQAKAGYPEVSLGVCPAVVAPWLIRKIGAGRARAMLLEGGTISGTQAHDIGLATHLVEHEHLEQATLDFAGKLCGGGAAAMKVTKHWINELDGSLEDESLERAWRLSAEVIVGKEAQQRLAKLFCG